MAETPLTRQAALMKDLGMWVHRASAPGWDEIRLLLKPVGEAVHVRVEEVRGRGSVVRTGELAPGSQAYADVHELRDLLYTHPSGTWHTFLIHLHARAWPVPTVSVDGVADYDDEPPHWEEGESADLSAEDLLEDYTTYPRTREATPEWVVRRVAEAGLHLPYIPAGESAPGRWPVVDAGSLGGADGPGAAAPRAVTDTRSGHRHVPRLAAPPEWLTVLVDRDGIPHEDGRRPQQHRRTVPGSASVREILDGLGLPLLFVDGHGTWMVVRGTSGADGAHTLGVVVQEGGGAVVHVTTDLEPWQLADEEGELALYYRSVPGPPAEVVAAAELDETWTPTRPRGAVADNLPVRRALERYSAAPGADRGLDVLRQALGGQLLLDCTGTVLGPDGEPTRVVVNFVTAPDGEKALPAFTHHSELVAFRRDDDGAARSLVQPAHGVLEFFVADGDAAWLYINPAGPPLGIHRDQVELALRPGHNAAVKNALMGCGPTGVPLGPHPDRPPSMQVLFDALRTEGGFLFLGEGAATTGTLLAFSSAVEVAAHDRSLPFRRTEVHRVLEQVTSDGLDVLRINPGGPQAEIPAEQVRRFLGLPPA